MNPDPLYAQVHFNHPVLVERLRALGYHDDQKDINLVDISSKEVNKETNINE